MSLEVQTRPGRDDYSASLLGGTQATDPAPTGVGMPPERNDCGLHLCPDCNAQFTRLEHLKRHATSLHGSLSAKPHGCDFCGRRFSRRDVLLRHYQSCRAAKAVSHLSEPASAARDKRASQICENCGESKLTSGGGSALQNSAELVHQCTAALRQKPSPNRRKESQTVSSLWPTPEDESSSVNANEARQVPSGSFSDTIHVSSQGPHSINLAPRRTDSEVGHSLTQNGNGFESIHQNDNDVIADDRSLGGSQRSSYFRPDTLTRRVADVGNRIADPPRPRPTSDEPPSPRGRRAANKRGRYVSNACKNCQKRKVKCSGEETCLQCRSAGLACAYNHGRKRRNTTSLVEDRPSPPPAETQPTIPLPGGETNLSESLSQMMARIASLERDCNTFKNLAAMSASHPPIIDAAENVSDYETSSPSETCSQSNSSVTSLPHTSIFRGATSLLKPIEALNHIISGEGQAQTDSEIETQPSQNQPSPGENRLLPPRSGSKDIKTIEKETRLEDQAFLRYAVDVYFSTLNPHYPSLNENYIRARLERFLANDSDQIGSGDWYQFVALLNLMKAEVKLMTYDWPENADAPAWEEFCDAETILNHLIWLGNGNVWTIQCLLIKARYLFYSERADCAYDTMGQIARLCFLVGLHNQSSWKGCSPFETVMRQRLFWTIFYLERNVSLNVGAPYLIRESDVKVDLPKNYDDKCLFPDRPLPDETPERSPGPYQVSTAKWGRLVAEIWDTIFGINAQKPTSQEFLASMDARISYTVSQFPEHLQWHRNMHRLDGSSDVPHYILRQTAILHCRMNQLRLLLRQESMLSLKYNDTTAGDVLSIASSSINAMHDHYNSQIYKPTERWSSVLFLTGGLLPLVCVIVKSENTQQLRADATEVFKKGLSLLYQMAPNFGTARHALSRLQRIIASATQTIHRFHSAELFSLDPKGFATESLLPQFTDFFNHEHCADPERDILNEQFQGPFSFNMNSMADPDFPGMVDHVDAFWVDDFLNNRLMLFPTGSTG